MIPPVTRPPGWCALLFGCVAATFLPLSALQAQAGLRFVQQPENTQVDQTFTVTVEAVNGSVRDTTFTGDVHIELDSHPTGATLSGTKKRAAVKGLVTFDGLSIDLAGEGYTLEAFVPPNPRVTSNPFDVVSSPEPPSGATSQITADPTSIPANGTSTSTITVQLKDQFGNDLTTGGDNVVLSRSPTLGTLGPVTDNGDGTYTAILTSGIVPGTVTISGTVNGANIADTATVTFTLTTATRLQFGQEPTGAGAGQTIAPAVTVRAVALGVTDPLFNGQVALAILTGPTSQLLGTTTKQAVNGVATFDNLSIRVAGTYTLHATASGLAPDTSAAFAISPGPPSGTTSQIDADPASIPADGSSTSTITVQLKDQFGNDLVTGGDNVVLSTTAGSLSAVTDNGNGTYTATLTSSTTPATAVVSGTVNGATIADTATVEFTQAGSPTLVVQVQPSATPVNAVITPAVVVRVTDGLGNTLTDFSGNVTVGLSANPTGATLSGTLVRAAQNGVAQFNDLRIDRPGTGYRLGFSSPQVTGATSVAFAVTSGAASPSTSLITADPTSIPADGTSTSAITVQLRDTNGNPLASGGDDVGLTTTLGTLGAVSDRGNGIYTATLTSSTTPGTATIRGTVNGAQITDAATVTFAAGTADLEVEVTVSNDTPTVGDNVVYVVTVRNGGPEPATGVQLTQDLHPRLGFVSATTSQGSYEAATGIWSVGALAVGQRATLTLVVTVRGAGGG